MTVRPLSSLAFSSALTPASARFLVTGGVDGIITDYPRIFHAWMKAEGLKVAPVPSTTTRIDKCLAEHNQLV
jgi:hypothetical protein